MKSKDLLLAMLVVLVWGANFVVIKVGLQGMPPMLMGAFRLAFAAIPAVFFVKRPQVSWWWLLAYGMTIAFAQFAFLFSAISIGMPAGLASLVLQAQAFFTLAFAGVVLREKLQLPGVAGVFLAAAGLAIIGATGGTAVPVAGLALTLCAALSWAAGDIITKKLAHADMLGLVVWGSLVPPVPFLLMSTVFEGPHRIAAALTNIDLSSIAAILYLALAASLFGYGGWSRLLSRYPASQVAPFSLLVPIIAMASAWIVLGERLSAAQLGGSALVMSGLLINVFGAWMMSRLRAPKPGTTDHPHVHRDGTPVDAELTRL